MPLSALRALWSMFSFVLMRVKANACPRKRKTAFYYHQTSAREPGVLFSLHRKCLDLKKQKCVIFNSSGSIEFPWRTAAASGPHVLCSEQSRQAHITHTDVDTVWLIYSTAPDHYTLLVLCFCLFEIISDQTIRTKGHILSVHTHTQTHTKNERPTSIEIILNISN